MTQQQEGWPLGLRPFSSRIGLVRNRDSSGSISFSTLLTGSPTSSTASSDLDTESTVSFFHDNSKSITLGSLVGISSILGISRRSSTAGKPPETNRNKISKAKPWLLSLCSKLSTDAVNSMKPISSSTETPSVAHFLRQQRRDTAGNNIRRSSNQSSTSGSSPAIQVLA